MWTCTQKSFFSFCEGKIADGVGGGGLPLCEGKIADGVGGGGLPLCEGKCSDIPGGHCPVFLCPYQIIEARRRTLLAENAVSGWGTYTEVLLFTDVTPQRTQIPTTDTLDCQSEYCYLPMLHPGEHSAMI
ncbi:hypothetical protein BaRGS_00039301 [Batillaria attramentaria]|uniref:Uncharacterized protein n=1 Tax=Batillaria attramentaria TaxID=370345 RepID=A0ABD0J4C4_9CAEN